MERHITERKKIKLDLGKIGEFIATLRKEHKLTQEQLGAKVGVHGQAVSKWEKGVCAPNILLLNDLSKILEVTTTELLNGKKIDKISQNDIEVATTETIKYYNHLNEKKLRKKMLMVILCMLIIIGVVFAVLFFRNNYENCFMYSIESDAEEYVVKGFLALTPNNETLSIHSIENITNFDSMDIKAYTYQYALYLSDVELFKEGNISLYEYQKGDQLLLFDEILSKIRIYESENSRYNEIIKGNRLQTENLSLKITYLDKNKEIKEKEILLKLKPQYINNQVFYDGGEEF